MDGEPGGGRVDGGNQDVVEERPHPLHCRGEQINDLRADVGEPIAELTERLTERLGALSEDRERAADQPGGDQNDPERRGDQRGRLAEEAEDLDRPLRRDDREHPASDAEERCADQVEALAQTFAVDEVGGRLEAGLEPGGEQAERTGDESDEAGAEVGERLLQVRETTRERLGEILGGADDPLVLAEASDECLQERVRGDLAGFLHGEQCRRVAAGELVGEELDDIDARQVLGELVELVPLQLTDGDDLADGALNARQVVDRAARERDGVSDRPH